ncbi:hypothetical protein M3612_17845 [Niallia taxi]|uniref:hypothetical protein n=1 Tax=Niallia taxi TaxID=2499688 RepID=UPI00203EE17E|nr:hypothetical protein [Niallia taxi]MCM3216350.1 hypothetical protein [Niallia taxi]
MTFVSTYHERNLKNLAQLGDNTKMSAVTWYAWLIANEIDVLIYETVRTLETQKGYLASGKILNFKIISYRWTSLRFCSCRWKRNFVEWIR